ncbi:MAG: ATP-binding protein, partial [Bacteroidota bacterium]
EFFRRYGNCISQQNELWLANGTGIARLDLNAFYASYDEQLIPQLYLNGFTVNEAQFSALGQLVGRASVELAPSAIEYTEMEPFHHYPQQLEVPHRTNHFTFDFVAIDWSAPHKVRYQYKLDGLEEEWSQPKAENRVDYRSIPFGKYTFKVRAAGRNGVWSEPVAYAFTIRPPWWHSWWAYVIYALILADFVYLGYRALRKRFLLKSALQHEQAEALRLRELDGFKSRLYTSLTHEFRTPLTVILGMIRQIRNAPGEYLKEGTFLIEKNGENLLRLINQMLDLSKLENNAFVLHPEQGDIVPYLRYLVESFHSYANGNNLALRFSTTLETLVLDYDPEQIKQVATNLISNAIKFTPSGGEVLVSLKAESEEWLFSVTDTGIGIAEQDLPRVFDRFFQVDGTTVRTGEGTGIGLSHTRELVKLMGGDITATSELDKGTCFTVRLPISNEAELVINPMHLVPVTYGRGSASELKGAAPKNDLTRKELPQLLIIEDNPDVVIYLKSCLKDDYQLDVAYNGLIGIEKALDNVPDIILSDVMMPGKDGFEVCDVLKNDERTSHIPLILLTAKADASSRIAGLKRGADAYLAKPFNREELSVRLAALLERQKRLVAHFSQTAGGKSDEAMPKVIEEAIQIEDAFITKVRQIVAENFADDGFALPQLCEKIGMSRSQLFRKMKALIATTPSAFIRQY